MLLIDVSVVLVLQHHRQGERPCACAGEQRQCVCEGSENERSEQQRPSWSPSSTVERSGAAKTLCRSDHRTGELVTVHRGAMIAARGSEIRVGWPRLAVALMWSAVVWQCTASRSLCPTSQRTTILWYTADRPDDCVIVCCSSREEHQRRCFASMSDVRCQVSGPPHRPQTCSGLFIVHGIGVLGSATCCSLSCELAISTPSSSYRCLALPLANATSTSEEVAERCGTRHSQVQSRCTALRAGRQHLLVPAPLCNTRLHRVRDRILDPRLAAHTAPLNVRLGV